jgi:hypothetical protein
LAQIRRLAQGRERDAILRTKARPGPDLAVDKDDVAAFKARLDEHFASTLETSACDVPHAKVGAVLGFVHENVKVVDEQWDEWGARLMVRGAPDVMDRLRAMIGDVGEVPPRPVPE